MAVRRTNSEVRATHRTLIAAGLLLAGAGAALDFVPVLADLMPFGAAAQMGYTLAVCWCTVGGTSTRPGSSGASWAGRTGGSTGTTWPAPRGRRGCGPPHRLERVARRAR